MKLPVEDDFNDIISKAQKGLGVSTEDLAKETGIDEGMIRALRRGELDEASLIVLAKRLGLRCEPLLKIAKRKWRPKSVGVFPGLELIATPFYDLKVNSFLIWTPGSKQVIGFDTGTEADPTIEFLKGNGLELEALLLTHTHRDHIEGLSDLRANFEFPVFVSEKEESIPEGSEIVTDGFTREFGELKIEAFATTGHTPGGLSYLVTGLEKPIVVVGDALFAGSMGGPNGPYEDSLAAVGRILDLPPETIIASGHGPLTTVAEERVMNCFWQG